VKRVGVILAAGESRRMGRDKALLPWRGGTLLAAGLAALRPVCDAVIVVAGRNHAALRAAAEAGGAAIAVNAAPERGQFSSLQTGLAAARAMGGEGAVITPVDCPPLEEAALRRLCEACGAWAAVPVHAGRRGHPLVAGPALVLALLAEPVTGNARMVMRRRAEGIVTVETAAALEDFDTEEAYQRALASRLE
jgi:molybdenum cofactor cytidylyltransferase